MKLHYKVLSVLIVSILLITITITNLSRLRPNSDAAYVFYDSYDTPNIDTTKWTETDTENKLEQANGYLKVISGKAVPAWGDPAIYKTTPVSRVGGRAFVNVIRNTVSSGTGPVMHFGTSAFPGTPNQNGYGISTDLNGGTSPNLRFNSVVPGAQIPYRFSNGTPDYDPTTAKSIDYVTATVLRPTGSYHLVSGGTFGTYPNATLMWANENGVDTNLFPGINNNSGQAFISETRVADFGGDFASEYGISNSADSFTRSGNLAGSKPDIKVTETISPLVEQNWVVDSGTAATDGTKMSTSQYGRGIVTNTVSDGIFEVDMTSPGSGDFIGGIIFRRSDANNYIYFAAHNDRYRLASIEGGSFNLIADGTAAPLFGNGNTKRLRVIAHGNNICLYVNDADAFGQCHVVNFNSTATGVGLGQFPFLTTGAPGISTFDNFTVWPRTVTLPGGIVDMPTAPINGATIVVQDTFTDLNGTNLTAHISEIRPIGSTGWTSPNGTWNINNSNQTFPTLKASESISNNLTSIVTDTGLNDMSVSADLTLPTAISGTTEWFSGLILRYLDNQNYTYARFLWQAGSPEIEIWDVVNGVVSPNIMTPPGFMNATNISKLLSQGNTKNLKVAILGNQVAVYMDGVLIAQGTTSNMSAGTKAGLIITTDNDDLPSADDDLVTNPLTIFDNFEVRNVVLDAVAPPIISDLTGPVILTNSVSLAFTPVFDDASGTAFYRVYRSTSPGVLGSQINTDNSTTTGNYTDNSLGSVTGNYYYTIRAVDAAGNENTSLDNNQIVAQYDGESPAGSIFINNNANFTNSASVNLNLNASDANGPIQMMISNDPTFSGALYEAYNATKAWTLSSNNGLKTVYIRFQDSLNNISEYSDTITLDTIVPNGGISINNNASTTYARPVVLTIIGDGTGTNVSQMIISESSTFIGASYETFSTSKIFTLSDAFGTKTVYIMFRDEAGNESQVFFASIVYAAPLASPTPLITPTIVPSATVITTITSTPSVIVTITPTLSITATTIQTLTPTRAPTPTVSPTSSSILNLIGTGSNITRAMLLGGVLILSSVAVVVIPRRFSKK